MKLLPRSMPLAALALVVLAGCGGGGDGGDPLTDGGLGGSAAGFDASNYATTAQPVALSVLNTAEIGSLPFDLLTDVMAAGRSQTMVSPLDGLRAAAQRSHRAHTLAVETSTETCPSGGSVTASFDDADNNAAVSTGDRLTVTANACVFEGSTLQGGLDLRVDAYTPATSASPSESATLTLGLRNFTTDGVSVDGQAVLTLAAGATSASTSIAFSNTVLTGPGGSVTLGYRADLTATSTGSGTAAFNGPLTYAGTDLTLTQVSVFNLRASDGKPDSGVLRVREALGARIEIVAGESYFTYNYFSPSNTGTTPDATVRGAQIR